MKFVHIADMHFDAPFIALSDQGNLGDKKRMEQRKIFKKIIEYIKEENIKYFFIAGDLYEHKHIRKSTIEYINDLFKDDITLEGEISQKNKRGKNTTTGIKLYKLEEDSYIADTPGFSTFDIFEIPYRELDKYFV